MDKLLAKVLDAHGGLANWERTKKLTARVSLGGPFWAAHGWPGIYDGQTAAAPAIVNVLSVLSWLNLSAAATYSASKSAAWSLTNGLRNELRSQGTQVVGVHVGFMETDMTRDVPGPKPVPQTWCARPLKHWKPDAKKCWPTI